MYHSLLSMRTPLWTGPNFSSLFTEAVSSCYISKFSNSRRNKHPIRRVCRQYLSLEQFDCSIGTTRCCFGDV